MKRSRGVFCTLAILVAGTGLATTVRNVEAQNVVPATGTPGQVHILPANMDTTQWGWYDNAQKPALTVKPGDTIILETMMHFHDQFMPGKTLADLAKIRADNPGRGAHTLTGPIYVEGAEPGDVLKVQINKIVPRAYGMNVNYPGVAGLFPKQFPDGQIRLMYLDWDKKVAEFLPGIVVPLKPFPGIVAVARAEPGRYSTVPPGRYAGNLDLRELTAGTSLHIPVFVKGALLWTSDGHAAQGNGEINLTAIETAFKEFNITVDVIKGRSLEWPRVETPTHWLTVGYDEDLNKALDILKAETAKFIAEQRKVPAAEAERIMQQTWDCRIAEVVNIVKGAYCFNVKEGEAKAPDALPTSDTATDYVAHGRNADLNKALEEAAMGMINLLVEKRQMTRLDAYGLTSIAGDCRLGAVSDAEKNVHCLVPKSLWQAAR